MSDRKRSNLKGFDPITAFKAVQTLLSRIPEIDESERFDIEWNALYEWAQDNGALYPGDIGPFLPQLGHIFGIPYLKDNIVKWGEQGHEHDVFWLLHTTIRKPNGIALDIPLIQKLET